MAHHCAQPREPSRLRPWHLVNMSAGATAASGHEPLDDDRPPGLTDLADQLTSRPNDRPPDHSPPAPSRKFRAQVAVHVADFANTNGHETGSQDTDSSLEAT